MLQPVSAAGESVSIYISDDMSFTTERIVYNAVAAAGGSCHIKRYDSGVNFLEPFAGHHGVIVAGEREFSLLKNAEDFVKIDIPLGEDACCWYHNHRSEIGELLTAGFETIQNNGVFDRIKANKSARADNQKVIFHLSSYSIEMVWDSQADESLRETLSEYEEPISLHVYNMNFRRTNYREAQHETATSFARSTFMDEYPDVIIAMDNDALHYLQEHYTQMFYGVPVVFCGINSYDESLISSFSQFATGVTDFIDPTETVEFALASNPDINRIYTIFDETSSASPVKASLLRAIEERYSHKMDEIMSSGNQTFAEIIEQVQNLDKNTMILIGTYFSDKEGQFMPESEVAGRLSKAVDIPIYTIMSGYLGHGVVGGRVAYSRSFMAEAARMAMRILQGEDVSTIPIIHDVDSEKRFNTFIVDKKAADRFGISEKLYADRAVVLNAAKSVFKEYPVHSIAAVAALVVVFFIALLCVMLIQSKRVRDIALLNAEKEKENSRIKSEFLARMSHEIRTPLNAIIGINELILQDDISDKVRQNALVIKHSGQNLLSIVNDILDFSKIEAGKQELTYADYDIGSLLHDTISMIRVRVAGKPINVEIAVSPEFPAYLYGDEKCVRQILLNILGNAAKYTKEGLIKLNAAFEFDSSEKKSGFVVFTITDTGIGIKKEDIDKLFDAFSQVDTAANRKVEGTGLGLAITKKLVEMMDGSISIKSEYGKGSVFTLRLHQQIHEYKALENISDAFNKHAEDAEDAEQKKLRRFIAPDASILAVDDIDSNLLVIGGILMPYQVKVDMALSGQEAIDALLKNDYDFVFMDHMMPEMDGVETVKKIRSLGSERLRRIPIIALTANAISGMKEMYLENGFNDFISKPVEINEVDRIMQTWIPNEKKQPVTEDKKKPEVVRGLASVKGIDAAKGLRLFGGKTEAYEKILRLFAKELQTKIDEISKMLEEGSFDNFQHCIHSIKGTSGNVCCMEIFETSKDLESAIRESNYDYIREYAPLFAERARDITASINENLG